jgi:hypothetical protein
MGRNRGGRVFCLSSIPESEVIMATRTPSPAQLAARKKFAEMARNGSLNRKRQIAAKKRAVNPIEEDDVDKLRNEFEIYFAGEQKIAKRNGYRINKADEWIRFVDAARLKEQKKVKRNPAKKTVSQKISQLVHEGYPQKQAVAVALNEQRSGKVKRNPQAKSVASAYSANFKYCVEAKRSLGSAGSVFEMVAGFNTKTQAQNYIDAILESHPGVTLRIKTHK